MTTWVPRIATVVVMALLGAVVLGVGPAAAHIGLATSAPTEGEVLTRAPEEVTLTFTEELQPAFVQVAVTGADGASINAGAAVVEGPLVRQPVQIGGAGSYVVAYRVVSADGHPITGQLSFSITASDTDEGTAAIGPSAPGTPSPTPAPPPADLSSAGADDGASGWVLILGLAALLIALATPFLWRLRKSR